MIPMKESCILHCRKEMIMQIHADYYRITGYWCTAAILSLCEYWASNLPLFKDDKEIYLGPRSLQEIRKCLLNQASEVQISHALEALRSWGFIEIEDSFELWFCISKVQKAIDKLAEGGSE